MKHRMIFTEEEIQDILDAIGMAEAERPYSDVDFAKRLEALEKRFQAFVEMA